MLFAGITDTSYKVMLFLHVVSAIVAIAPTVVNPFLTKAAGRDAARLRAAMLANYRKIYAPALVLTGFLGFGVAGMSDEVYQVSDGWVIASVVLWVAMNGVLHGVQFPAERAAADGDAAAAKKAALANQAVTVLLAVTLVLMVFKPGA